MEQHFVDTWFFVAGIDRYDNDHNSARKIGARYRPAQLVTHDAVLTEVLAYFSGEGAPARAEAVRVVRDVVHRMVVLPAGRELFTRALDLYAAHPDKEYSLVDCMAMVVMEDRGIRHILTNDHHFTQAGFIVVNE